MVLRKGFLHSVHVSAPADFDFASNVRVGDFRQMSDALSKNDLKHTPLQMKPGHCFFIDFDEDFQ